MAKHAYQDLYNSYQGFIMPTYSIVVGGSDTFTQSDNPPIHSIQVELTAGYEASACNLEFYQGVDLDEAKNTFSVSQTIRDKLKLGSTIEVQLGYLKEKKSVFKGIITGVELEYEASSGFQIRLEGMDIKRLMMNSYHSTQPRKDLTKYGDAVKEVLKKYAKNIDKQTITLTQERTLPLEQHNQSDYDFLVSIAKRVNYAFYLVNNELFFEEFGQDKDSLLELHAQHLHSFYREVTLADQVSELTVRANDESDPGNVFESTAKTFTAIGKGKNAGHDITNIAKESAKKTLIDPSISSANEAKARAEAELARHAFKFAHGTFKTIGIPEIVPGKMITINGFGEEYDNDYYLKKVIHQYSSGGYFTKGELGVNKI